MNREGFFKLRRTLNKECEDILLKKGDTYSGKKDSLGNFKRVSEASGLSPKSVWLIYFLKHVDAIAAFCREEYDDPESIDTRIMDVRNYADILYAIVKEEK